MFICYLWHLKRLFSMIILVFMYCLLMEFKDKDVLQYDVNANM